MPRGAGLVNALICSQDQTMKHLFAAIWIGLGIAVSSPLCAAGGDVKVIEGADKEDGSAIKGLRLASEDEQAYLYFLCDADKPRPQIMITHRHVIGRTTDPFKVYYKIDDNGEQRHWFLVRGSGRTGYFFVRFPIEYKSRFGEQPSSFVEGGNAVNPEYQEWDRRIYATVVHDFLTGRNALVRIHDKQEEDHLYAFSLKGLAPKADALASCYDPSIVAD